LLDHTAGTLTVSSAIITNAQNHVDAFKTTALYLGASGSAIQVTASAAELNKLDGATVGTATASKAVVLDSNLHMNAVKTTGLYLGASGSAVLVSSTSAELNILDGATLAVAELNILDGVTASTAEINKLDGVTATTPELNSVAVSQSVVLVSTQFVEPSPTVVTL